MKRLLPLLFASSAAAYAPDRLPELDCVDQPAYDFAEKIVSVVENALGGPSGTANNIDVYSYSGFSIDDQLNQAKATSQESYNHFSEYYRCLKRDLPWLERSFDVLVFDKNRDYHSGGGLDEMWISNGPYKKILKFKHDP